MPYISNPSIPALPASTQTEVKIAIQNLTNWINTFNNSLGNTLGTTITTDGSTNYYSSALPSFVEKTLLGQKAVANVIKSLEGKIAESQLNTDLNNRINLIDAPSTGLVTQVSQISSQVNDNTASVEVLSQAVDGVKAEYTIKLNTNNKIAGIGLIAEEGSPTAFEVLVDEFAIVNSDGVTSTVPFIVTGGNTYIKSALISDLTADKITSGYLKAIHISVGDAANAVDFYEDGYSTVPLVSTAYSGWYYDGWVGTDIITNSSMYFGHNNLSLPINRRIKSGTVKVLMTWTGIVDSAMSIYYRINGGSWNCIAEGADSQADYGAASTSWVGDLSVPANGYIEFGMRPTSCSGYYYNGEKLAMNQTSLIVQIGNF